MKRGVRKPIEEIERMQFDQVDQVIATALTDSLGGQESGQAKENSPEAEEAIADHAQ